MLDLLSLGMASVASAIQSRISAVQRLLSSLKGTKSFATASKAQSQALQNELLKASLTLEETADIADAIRTLPWDEEDGEAPLAALLSAGSSLGASGVQKVAQRRALQDYSSLMNYFTEEQWMLLLSNTASSSEKMSLIIQHASVLGLRCPTEGTMQKLTTLYLLCAEGVGPTKAMLASQKLAMLKHMKKEVKALAKSNPLVYLQLLPQSPQLLLEEHCELYQTVFRSQPPVACKFCLQEFVEVSASVAMRSSKLSPSTLNLEGSNFSQVAGCVMQQLQAMQQVQLATIAALQGGSSPRFPQCLAALGNQAALPPAVATQEL